jgi:hypothetical protein
MKANVDSYLSHACKQAALGAAVGSLLACGSASPASPASDAAVDAFVGRRTFPDGSTAADASRDHHVVSSPEGSTASDAPRDHDVVGMPDSGVVGPDGGAPAPSDGGNDASPSGEAMPTGNFVSSASGITWEPFFLEDWDTPVAFGSWPVGANDSVPGTVYTGPHSAWNQPNEGGSDSAGHGVGPTQGNGLWLAAGTVSVGPGVSSSPYAPAGSSVNVPASVMDVFQYVPNGGAYSGHPLGACISPAVTYMNRNSATPYMAVAYRSRVIGWGEQTSAGFKMVPLFWPVGTVTGSELDFIESDYLGAQGSFVSFALHSEGSSNSIVNYFSDQGGTYANIIPTGASPSTPSVFDLQDWHTFVLEWYAGAVTWWCDGHLMGTETTGYSTNEWNQSTGAMTIPSDPLFWTWQIETSTLGTQPTASNWAHVQNDWQVIYRMAQ